jgi:hypothetical protein
MQRGRGAFQDESPALATLPRPIVPREVRVFQYRVVGNIVNQALGLLFFTNFKNQLARHLAH